MLALRSCGRCDVAATKEEKSGGPSGTPPSSVFGLLSLPEASTRPHVVTILPETETASSDPDALAKEVLRRLQPEALSRFVDAVLEGAPGLRERGFMKTCSDPDGLAKEVVLQLQPDALSRFVNSILECQPGLKDRIMKQADEELLSHVHKMDADFHKQVQDALRKCRQGMDACVLGVNSCAGPPSDAKLLLDATDTSSPSKAGQVAAESELFTSSSSSKLSEKAPTIIQFSTNIFFAVEEDGKVNLDVVRLGDSSTTSTVNYETHDASAIAGMKYLSSSGTLTFNPGEFNKPLEISILSDDRWDTTLEFSVLLSSPTQGRLGDHLSKARVKILDDDAFPTNKYREVYAKEGLAAISKTGLFVEYVKMSFMDPDIKKCSMRVLILDQCKNAHMAFFLVMKLYMIDAILGGDSNHPFLFGVDGSIVLVFVGLAIFVPQAIISACMVQKPFLRVGGFCRLKLQLNLMRKFLNYDESSRAAICISDLMLTMGHHIEEVVEHGFIGFLKLIRELGIMVVLLCYQIALASFANSPSSAVTIVVPSLSFPICMFIWLRIRHARSDALRMDMMLQEKQLAHHVDVTAHSARMIIDYQCRTATMDRIEQEIRWLNTCKNNCKVNFETNMQFAPVLAAIIIGFYVLIAGQQVLRGELPLGAFLVTIDIYVRVSGSWETVYDQLLVLHDSLPALEIIFWHMNLPTDLEMRRENEKKRRDLGHMERTKVREQMKTLVGERRELYAVDLLPIRLVDVAFKYDEPSGITKQLHAITKKKGHTFVGFGRGKHTQGGSAGPVVPVKTAKPKKTESAGISGISLEIQQGGLIGLVGKRGHGKSTVMRVLGGVLLPHEGSIFVPPHLRVYHVESQPMFFQMNLYDNLCFGVHNETGHETIEHVLLVCRSFGLDDAILEHVTDGQIHNWDEYLSLTQKWILHLARALISNPEVLVIHKPTLTFGNDMAIQVMTVFKEYVKNRGFCATSEDVRSRRKRTCIITEERIEGLNEFDQIFVITGTASRSVSADELSLEHLF